MATAPKELRQEIATAKTDPWRWWEGGRITSADQVLAQRGQGKGLWLYDELARDPKVGAALDKRRLALVGREWMLEPADETPQAQAAHDLVQQALDAIAFNRVVGKLLEATLKGIAVAEVMWQARDGAILPSRIIARDPRRFAFREVEDAEPELRLLTQAQPLDGIAVPARKFVVHRYGDRYDNPWGIGLGQRLFWPVYFKRQGVGFWMSALEKFAAPTAVGKYPAGTSDADQKKLLDAVAAIASEAAVIIPEGMMVELLEAKRAGAFDTYESLARYMDEDIAVAVFGETLTTSAGSKGSQALGKVHDGVRLELIRADADLLSDTLNGGLVRWIVELNLPGYPVPRLWWDVSEPEDLNARATRDKALFDAGWTFTPERMAEIYGEGIVAKPAAPPPGQSAGAGAPGQPQPQPAETVLGALFAEARRAVRKGRMPKAAPARDTSDDLAEQLDQLAGAAQDRTIEAIRALVARAETMQDVADQLLALYPQIDTAALAELMGDALTVAALAGRSDLADGA